MHLLRSWLVEVLVFDFLGNSDKRGYRIKRYLYEGQAKRTNSTNEHI